MSIHALPDIPGVDVAELLERELAESVSREAQDNVPWDDDDDETEIDPAASRAGAEKAYYRVMSQRRGLRR